jgi:hypothetical protein
LKFYTICFGTESHPAAIPFDFQVDCLLFDNWLATLTTQYFRSRPPVERQIEPEMQQIVGQMGYVERNSIHRIVISIDLYLRLTYNVFIPGLRVLLRNFPSTEYVIFVAEERTTFICFFDVTMREYRCEDCWVHVMARLPAAVDEPLAEFKDESEDEDQEPSRFQVRFRSIWREYYDERYECSPPRVPEWFCLNAGKEEGREAELLFPVVDEPSDSEDSKDSENEVAPSGDVRMKDDNNGQVAPTSGRIDTIDNTTEHSKEAIGTKEKDDEEDGDLEEGGLEELLAVAAGDIKAAKTAQIGSYSDIPYRSASTKISSTIVLDSCRPLELSYRLKNSFSAAEFRQQLSSDHF